MALLVPTPPSNMYFFLFLPEIPMIRNTGWVLAVSPARVHTDMYLDVIDPLHSAHFLLPSTIFVFPALPPFFFFLFFHPL